MLNKLVKTNEDYALTIARLVLGILFFIHGDQLMLGWFGGYGLSGSMGFFTKDLGIPAPFAFLAICAEFFGGLMLIAGFLGRIAALTIICTMAVAVVKVHWQFGVSGFKSNHRFVGIALVSCEQSIITWHQSLRWNPAFRRRRALAMTETELRLIEALAIIGFRRMPVNG